MFSNFISLGPNCVVASSMSKYGLRSFSSPFDWLITNNFEWILHYMDNDFEDFLQKENLEEYENSSKKFRDNKSDIIFVHDEEFEFKKNYKELNQKYQKRINRFLFETTKPTCFLRAVMNYEEIKYIKKNSGYIDKVIKRRNKDNIIVFLIKKGLEVDQLPFKFFCINKEYCKSTTALMRSWFDNEMELLEFCASNFNISKMMENICFDHKKIYAVHEKNFSTILNRYNIALSLLETDFENILIPTNIIIYGAGNIGKQFYKKIKGKCNVKYFVDEKQGGTLIDQIPVVNYLNEIKYAKNLTFVVTAIYDFENIYNIIKQYNNDAEVISLQDLLINNEEG